MKNLPVNAGDAGSVPGSGRCPGGGNSNPLQVSCLGDRMDRGVRWVAESDTTELLNKKKPSLSRPFGACTSTPVHGCHDDDLSKLWGSCV